MPHRRRTKHPARKPAQPERARKSQQTQPDPYDFRLVGGRSTDELEASQLPDHGRGSVNTAAGKELKRRPPDQTGENATGDVGLRATPEIADVKQHGHRKRN